MTSAEPTKNLTLDYSSVCADTENVLDEIRTIRTDKLFSQAFGTEMVKNLKSYENAVRKRITDPFNLVIVGDFKRGKSTLINAILGKAIVPTSVTPETVTINKLSYAEMPRVEVVLKNGRRTEIDPSELRREQIEKVAKQFPAQIDFVDVKENADILKEISIIDTPGIGDLLKAFDAQVAEYLVNADALIFVISARAPMSLTEAAFLSTSVMPQSFSRVILLVNMVDTLETQENIDKIIAMVEEKARTISQNIYVYPVSALDEYCRKLDLKRPEPDLAQALESDFLAFETSLQNDIVLEKEVIKSARVVSLTGLMLDNLVKRAQLLRGTLSTNIEKLSADESKYDDQNKELMETIEREKTALCGDISQMKTEAMDWMVAFMDRVKEEIKVIQTTATVSDLERHFQFYLMDKSREAIQACLDRHQKEIMDRIAADAKSFASDISKVKFGSVDTQIADCITDISWTSIDTVTSSIEVAGKLLGIKDTFSVVTLLGQTIAGFVRMGVVNKKQNNFLTPVLADFSNITSEIIAKVGEVYDQFKASAADKLYDLYQNQIEVSNDAIKQAQEIVKNEGIKKEEIEAYLDALIANLDDLKETMDKYQ
jgi:small GTP-binding protein